VPAPDEAASPNAWVVGVAGDGTVGRMSDRGAVAAVPFAPTSGFVSVYVPFATCAPGVGVRSAIYLSLQTYCASNRHVVLPMVLVVAVDEFVTTIPVEK